MSNFDKFFYSFLFIIVNKIANNNIMEQQLKPIPNLFGTSFDGIISGVYKITSPRGKVYIGESKNIHNRWRQYKWLSSKKQRKLHDSFIEYGVYSHKFEIIHILDANGKYIEYEHHPKLHALEIMYIGQYKDFDNDLLNIHRGGKNKYYIDKNGRRTKLSHPRFTYEIFNPNTSQIDIVTILDEYMEKNSIGCYKKLASTLYGYDRLGNKNEFTKGFGIISKKCLLDNVLDAILQESIESEKKRRYEVRLNKNIVDLGSPEYSIKCGSILREHIYTYIDVKTFKIGIIENVKKFCREHVPQIKDEKQLRQKSVKPRRL